MLVNPLAGGELRHQRFVELPPMAIADVLDTGLRGFQLGFPEQSGQPAILPPGVLAINEQTEALIE